MKALKEATMTIPEDVSIVGFDDIEFVALIDPPLTTVRVPRYEMGVESAKLLLAQMSEGPGDTPHGTFY
jgi:DNA-binding LacI/PurR family transcriptional regulator